MTDKTPWDIGKIDPELLAEAAREAREMEGETEAAKQNKQNKRGSRHHCGDDGCRLEGTPVSAGFNAIMGAMSGLAAQFGQRGPDGSAAAHAALVATFVAVTGNGTPANRKQAIENLINLAEELDKCRSEDDLRSLVHDVLEQIQFGDD